MDQMFQVTQDYPGDLAAQDLHKLRGLALLQGQSLVAQTAFIPTAPHPYRQPCFHCRKKMKLKAVKGRCYESIKPWSGQVGSYNKTAHMTSARCNNPAVKALPNSSLH